MSSPSETLKFTSICILLISFFLLSNHIVKTEAQDCLVPPSMHGQGNEWDSWPTLTVINVRLSDTWTDTERGYFETGIRKWNGTPFPNCALARFEGFSPFHVTNPAASPPDNTADWIEHLPSNGFDAEVLYHYIDEVQYKIRAVRHFIKPDIVNVVNNSYFVYLGTHETGHEFDLGDCLSQTGCPVGDKSIMSGVSNNAAFNTGGPKICDHTRVNLIYCGQAEMPTPSPTPESSPWFWPNPFPPIEVEPCQNGGWFWNFISNNCNGEESSASCPHHCIPYNPLESGGCNDAADYCAFPYGCPPGTVDGGQGCCCYPTPILIDVLGNGFELTNGSGGVSFDMGGDGHREPMSWTTANSDDAWLAIDRNGNGIIDSSKEMFGNFTDQPHATTTRNGFIALAEFDLSENGGNDDGKINSSDSIFSQLRLWQDRNHNGLSEPSELYSLSSLGVATLELDFKESKRVDDHGNRFGYRAKVKDIHGVQIGRWAWDVTLTTPTLAEQTSSFVRTNAPKPNN